MSEFLLWLCFLLHFPERQSLTVPRIINLAGPPGYRAPKICLPLPYQCYSQLKKKIKPEFWRLNSGSRELLPQLRHPQFLYSVPLKKSVLTVIANKAMYTYVFMYMLVFWIQILILGACIAWIRN